MNGYPFLPGDMILVKLNGLDLRPLMEGYNTDVQHTEGWVKLRKDDLLTVIATGPIVDETWRWYFMFHNSKMKYGWVTIRIVAPPPRNFERVS